MTWIIIITILFVWYASSQKKVERTVNENTYIEDVPKTITEDEVLKRENAFDESIDEEIDFPDAIRGQDIYVYRKLLRKWFRKLTSANRYNEETVQKIRRDWIDYMNLMKERKTLMYLSMEDATDASQYRKEANLVTQKMFAIEDAFAATVGKEAEDELSRIYDMDHHSFDKFGNIAPSGYLYNPGGKLVRKKSK